MKQIDQIRSPYASTWSQISTRWLRPVLVLGLLVAAVAIYSYFQPSGPTQMAPQNPLLAALAPQNLGGEIIPGGLVVGIIGLLALVGIARPRLIGLVIEGISSVFVFIIALMFILIEPISPIFAWIEKKIRFSVNLKNYFLRILPLGDPTDSETMTRFPESQFSELYQEIPNDIALPVVSDGRLPGGAGTEWLARRGISRELFAASLGRALTVALVIWVGGLAYILFSAADNFATSAVYQHRESSVRSEIAGIQKKINELKPAVQAGNFKAIQQTEILAHRAQQIESQNQISVPQPPAHQTDYWTLLLADLAAGFLVFAAMSRAGVGLATREAGERFLNQTKDSLVRYPYRIDQHLTVRETLRRQITEATGRLAETKTIKLGTATGRLRIAGSLMTPAPGTPICIDEESIFQHLMVFGGTGEGKTRAFLRPIARQVFTLDRKFGFLALDAKAGLWRDLNEIALQTGRADDVSVIGIEAEAGQKTVDLLDALDPSALAYVVRALMDQSGGETSGNGAFFRDTGATALRHTATICEAAGEYNLIRIYECLVDGTVMIAMLNAAKAAARGVPGVRESIIYIESFFVPLVQETKDGIIATLATVLDPICTDPRFAGFLERQAGNQVSISSLFSGRILLCAISITATGLAGRLVIMAIKAGLMRAARLREQETSAMSSSTPSCPVVLMVDEAQEIATAGKNGLSDALFFNLARSARVAGIYATQTIAALDVALGKDAAKNLIEQFRSRVYLRTEDPSTIKEIEELAGKYLRSHVYERNHYESVEAMAAATGQAYLRPIETDQADALNAFYALGARLRIAGLAGAWAKSSIYVKSPIYRPVQMAVPAATDKAGLTSVQMAQAQWAYQETVRQGDLARNWLHQGHEERSAIDGAEVAQWGRFHAFVYAQRAGAVRFDIVAVDHSNP